MASKSKISSRGSGGIGVTVTVSKSFGKDAFNTTAVAPRVALAEAVLLSATQWIKVNAPRESGRLATSFQDRKGGSGVSITGSDQRSVRVDISSDVEYGSALDAGKRRGAGRRPPVRAIQNWLRRIGADDDPDVAAAIAVSIGRRGVQSGPDFLSGPNKGSATKGWSKKLTEHVRDAVRENSAAMVRGIVNDILGK